MSLEKPFSIRMKKYQGKKFLGWVEQEFANADELCTFYEKNTQKTSQKRTKRGGKKKKKNNNNEAE